METVHPLATTNNQQTNRKVFRNNDEPTTKNQRKIAWRIFTLLKYFWTFSSLVFFFFSLSLSIVLFFLFRKTVIALISFTQHQTPSAKRRASSTISGKCWDRKNFIEMYSRCRIVRETKRRETHAISLRHSRSNHMILLEWMLLKGNFHLIFPTKENYHLSTDFTPPSPDSSCSNFCSVISFVFPPIFFSFSLSFHFLFFQCFFCFISQQTNRKTPRRHYVISFMGKLILIL